MGFVLCGLYTISVYAYGLCSTFYFLYFITLTGSGFGDWYPLFGGLFAFVYV